MRRSEEERGGKGRKGEERGGMTTYKDKKDELQSPVKNQNVKM